MSRQSRIYEALQALQTAGAIQSFHKGYSEGDPARLEWLVQISNFDLQVFNSREVDAFISGAKAVSMLEAPTPVP